MDWEGNFCVEQILGKLCLCFKPCSTVLCFFFFQQTLGTITAVPIKVPQVSSLQRLAGQGPAVLPQVGNTVPCVVLYVFSCVPIWHQGLCRFAHSFDWTNLVDPVCYWATHLQWVEKQSYDFLQFLKKRNIRYILGVYC